MCANLPESCYAASPYTGQTVKIIRGETCFFCLRAEDYSAINRDRGVSDVQRAAMVGGVVYGWDSKQADPQNYTVAGIYHDPAEMEM